jgi:hypothetical protein
MAVAFLVGCGGGGQEGTSLERQPEVAVDPGTAASVSGEVRYQGPQVKPVPIDMGADPACAKSNAEPVYAQDLVVNSNGTLRNALVFIKDGLPPGKYPLPKSQPSLDQKGCMYHPRVIGVMVGQEFQIGNSDPTMHNIHPSPKENREWNRAQIQGGAPFHDHFSHKEIAVPVKCNVHPWMKAWIAVLEHPYFAVTGEDGSFEIQGLPPGDYTIEVWHEKLGTMDQKVTLAPKQAGHADFTLAGGSGA